MTGRDPRAGAKIVFKLLIVTQRRVLKTNQGGLSNKEKLRKCLIFNYGYTGWQSTPQNQLSINLPNLVTDWKKPYGRSKIVLKLLFLTPRRLLTKNQRSLSNRENGLK